MQGVGTTECSGMGTRLPTTIPAASLTQDSQAGQGRVGRGNGANVEAPNSSACGCGCLVGWEEGTNCLRLHTRKGFQACKHDSLDPIVAGCSTWCLRGRTAWNSLPGAVYSPITARFLLQNNCNPTFNTSKNLPKAPKF